MELIPEAEVERLMRVREVMLQAMSKKITWWQAGEILGVSARTMRRWKWQYERHGFRGIRDQRKGKSSWRKVPMEEVNRVLTLYREQYFDLNVRHFHEKLRAHHQVNWSYTWDQERAAGGRAGEASPIAAAASKTTAPQKPARDDVAY